MIDTKEIKQRINCVDYARRNGLSINRSGDRCVSPLRSTAKNNTSFVVYDEFFYDFGSGEGGDVIDFAAALKFDGDKGKAIKELALITGVSVPQQHNEWVNYTQNLCNEVQHYHEQLTDNDRKYIHNRNINDDTINRLKIGRTDDGRLCIPYWKNGYICYYATRYMPGGAFPDSKYKKMKIDQFNEHTVWGLHTLDRKCDTLVIAEGAFDALSFDQENFSVISAITGHFSSNQLPTALSIAKSFEKVFLVFDNDKVTKAGEKFTIKMAKILIQNRIPCIVGRVPPTYKDVSEFYADGGNLQDLIDTAIDGATFLATKFDKIEDFDAFAKSVCRYMSNLQIDLFFEQVKNADVFPTHLLKSIIKECKKAPSDETIANEIIKKYDLLYNPKISFFEYNGKHWEEKNDYEISVYIIDALSHYATGARVSSILKLLKSKTITSEIFNVSPVMNFINGTLEIEPEIKFREHRKSDYCTYMLNYPYMPSARSNEWQTFVETITDYDDKKIALLQELAGYVLYPDNRLQKCAVLIGSGANGKSVFLNVITKIFGSSNISNVEMSALSQDFQAIQLMNSMLNISAETKTNVSGAEAKFKQVVAGDEITACYKGKDYITFKPRAKMFLACNEYVKSSDTTDGWNRRFCFVNFPMKFCENPTKPNELPIIRDIEFQLSTPEQLSAIFNWVLQGYQMVKACGYFTEPDDQKAIVEEFKEISNPVIEFVKDLKIQYDKPYSELYQNYRYWCDETGHKPLNSNTFVKRVRKAVEEYRTDLEFFKTSKCRGIRPKA